ncbi:hypothetical protein [Paenibacillus sp. YYML68]|uniref:hypothetical protein n=1 Tax=Paenibacillus sp. YYML68 TaxID=2909250 RepID=UPI002492B5B7|nr:hypothetical protein [Paenibacillus sp. YYML68]
MFLLKMKSRHLQLVFISLLLLTFAVCMLLGLALDVAVKMTFIVQFEAMLLYLLTLGHYLYLRLAKQRHSISLLQRLAFIQGVLAAGVYVPYFVFHVEEIAQLLPLHLLCMLLMGITILQLFQFIHAAESGKWLTYRQLIGLVMQPMRDNKGNKVWSTSHFQSRINRIFEQ